MFLTYQTEQIEEVALPHIRVRFDQRSNVTDFVGINSGDTQIGCRHTADKQIPPPLLPLNILILSALSAPKNGERGRLPT